MAGTGPDVFSFHLFNRRKRRWDGLESVAPLIDRVQWTGQDSAAQPRLAGKARFTAESYRNIEAASCSLWDGKHSVIISGG